MKTVITICMLLGALLCGVSCKPSKAAAPTKQPYPPGYFAKQIEKLESANVTKDVAAAVRNSDFRFLVCIGYAPVIPGVPQWNEKLRKKCGTRVLDGTGDMVLSEEQGRFKAAAAAYAEAYNKLLLVKLGN